MEFVIIAALIISNGILAMSEIALVSLRKSNLALDAKTEANRQKRRWLWRKIPIDFFNRTNRNYANWNPNRHIFRRRPRR